MNEIRAHAEALELDEAAMLDRLQAQRTAADAERQESVRQEIGKLRRRVYELEQMTAKLYEDKVCGSISAASFAVLLEKTEQERRQRTDRLDTLLAEIRSMSRAPPTFRAGRQSSESTCIYGSLTVKRWTS